MISRKQPGEGCFFVYERRALNGRICLSLRAEMRDFAAIDFETANEWPSSVCSVGVVVVRDGCVEERLYSLIHPEPEYYSWFCRVAFHPVCLE